MGDDDATVDLVANCGYPRSIGKTSVAGLRPTLTSKLLFEPSARVDEAGAM